MVRLASGHTRKLHARNQKKRTYQQECILKKLQLVFCSSTGWKNEENFTINMTSFYVVWNLFRSNIQHLIVVSHLFYMDTFLNSFDKKSRRFPLPYAFILYLLKIFCFLFLLSVAKRQEPYTHCTLKSIQVHYAMFTVH